MALLFFPAESADFGFDNFAAFNDDLGWPRSSATGDLMKVLIIFFISDFPIPAVCFKRLLFTLSTTVAATLLAMAFAAEDIWDGEGFAEDETACFTDDRLSLSELLSVFVDSGVKASMDFSFTLASSNAIF
jgi:hypothetical protein